MAIIGTLQVTLHSHDGTRLNEYPDHDTPLSIENYDLQDNGMSLNYVEVIAESEFSIKCVVEDMDNITCDLSFTAEVDGTRVATNVASMDAINTGYWHGEINALCKRVNAYQVTNRPLQFSGLTTIDADDPEQVRKDAKIMRQVGEVLVFVHRTLREGVEATVNTNEPIVVKEVSEKSLKGQAISHTVSYGPARIAMKPQGSGVHYVDSFYVPVGVFRFKYRSKQALQAMLVIPRSPTPEPIRLPNPVNIKRQVTNHGSHPVNIVPISDVDRNNRRSHNFSRARLPSMNSPNSQMNNSEGERVEDWNSPEWEMNGNMDYGGNGGGKLGADDDIYNPNRQRSSRPFSKQQKIDFLERQLQQLKSEEAGGEPSNVKREGSESPHGGRPFKIVKKGNGRHVIDLTDD